MKSLAELQAIRNRMIDQVNMRKDDNIDTRVVVGMATCGIAAWRTSPSLRPAASAFAAWSPWSRFTSRARRRSPTSR